MLLFNKVDVYIGYSIDELAKVRVVLENQGIKYSYKIVNQSAELTELGTFRGNFGSTAMNLKYDSQYIVSVKKADFERADYIIRKALQTST